VECWSDGPKPITPFFSWPIPVMDESLIGELDKIGFIVRLSEGR